MGEFVVPEPEHSGASSRDDGLSEAARDLVSGRSDELYPSVEDAAVRPEPTVQPEQAPVSAEQQAAELEAVEIAAMRDGRPKPIDSAALNRLVGPDADSK